MTMHGSMNINPLKAELNPIYHLLALLGAQPILHVSRIRVKKYTKTFIKYDIGEFYGEKNLHSH
jgi:hypothetical protein